MSVRGVGGGARREEPAEGQRVRGWGRGERTRDALRFPLQRLWATSIQSRRPTAWTGGGGSRRIGPPGRLPFPSLPPPLVDGRRGGGRGQGGRAPGGPAGCLPPSAASSPAVERGYGIEGGEGRAPSTRGGRRGGRPRPRDQPPTSPFPLPCPPRRALSPPPATPSSSNQKAGLFRGETPVCVCGGGVIAALQRPRVNGSRPNRPWWTVPPQRVVRRPTASWVLLPPPDAVGEL